MSALLTYRSRNSFESRFGRNMPDPSRRQNINMNESNEHFAIHNQGHRNAGSPRPTRNSSTNDLTSSIESLRSIPPAVVTPTVMDPQFHGTTPLSTPPLPASATKKNRTPTYFSAQSYLRYQGEKFIKRFDANCYIAITRKLDTHDVSRDRIPSTSSTPVADALKLISQPTIVLGIESDGLFTFAEQQELAAAIPNAVLKVIDSSEGHDAFLLEFEQVNKFILDFLTEALPDVMSRQPVSITTGEGEEATKTAKTSTFGEAEDPDIVAW